MRLSNMMLIVVCLASSVSCNKSNTGSAAKEMAPLPPAPRLEGYPSDVIDAKAATPLRTTSSGPIADQFQSVISISRTWTPNTYQAGSTITVAFLGGSNELRSKIAHGVQPWLDVANISFDFGPEAAAGKFREWTTSDTTYSADIRIAFLGGEGGGYWSLVGKDSINPAIRKPNQPSMNFGGFPDGLPDDWQATVVHEFGQALGFEHEHQSPVAPCESEFRWNDAPGYVPTRNRYREFVPDSQNRNPGIYRVLEGPPNNWKENQINYNLRQLAQSTDYLTTAFDDESIMKYQFPEWMFIHGKQSPCYSQENLVLSQQDIATAGQIYPRNAQATRRNLVAQQKGLQQLVKVPGLSAEAKAKYRSDIQQVNAALKP